MVSLVVGFPGSGKSYFAVKKIYDILSSTKKQSFKIIYTNIGGIKFDYFPNSQVEFKKLKESDLLEYISECFKIYELHKNEDNVDDYLIEYSKAENFYDCLIIFDECHDFFSSQDRIKIFWLTYHRHLNHEIILLTQNKSLINTKYRAIPEQFIEAQARSKKLFSNTLNYKHFSSFAMRKTDLFNTSSIKTNPTVFELYQSGNKSSQKSIIVKFIGILTLGLIIAIFLFMNLLDGFYSDSEKLDENLQDLEQKKIKNIPKKTTNIFPKTNIKYFNMEINYNSEDGYKIYDKYYKSQYFRKFIKTTKSKILYKTVIFKQDNYLIQKLILKTSNDDLEKYFLIPNNKSKTIKRLNQKRLNNDSKKEK